MKKRLIIISAAIAVFAGIAVAAYAAYDVTGSSPASPFNAGTAVDLAVDPDESDLVGILPGETKVMDVQITNNNAVPVTVTGLSATFSPGICALSAVPIGTYPFPLGASSGVGVQMNVTMGDPDPGCEGYGLTVTATAGGTMP